MNKLKLHIRFYLHAYIYTLFIYIYIYGVYYTLLDGSEAVTVVCSLASGGLRLYTQATARQACREA